VNGRAKSCGALAIAFVCLTSPAFADKETIALDYTASSGCPDRAKFVERVHTFTSKADIASDDGLPHRKFGIRVVRSAGVVRGELTIDDRGAKTTRDVSGNTCDEVVSALALATAIAVDPEALSGEPVSAPTPPPEPPAPTPTPAPPKPPPPKPAPPPLKPRLDAPHPKPELRHALDLSLGTRVGDTLAPFERFEGVVELGTTYIAPLDLHLGVAFGPPQHNGQAEFSDWLGWLGAGYRLFELEPLSVWGQAALELGRVRATGRGIEPRRSVDKLWAAVDVGMSVRLDAPGPLFFQLNASGRAPLSLQRYVVLENTGKLLELHQVGQLGYLLGLSVGMHFL
jgi:hypothetical protein